MIQYAPKEAPEVLHVGARLYYPGGNWTCSRTGMVVAMTPARNAQQRASILAKCENDLDARKKVLAMCRRSFLVWLNLFAWTYVVYTIKATGERVARMDSKDCPFVAWPCQEVAYEALEAARARGRDLAIQKSREMGATWEVLAWMVWMSLFHGSPMGVASRKADLVDKSGDPDALFTKIDYIVRRLPSWMRGKVSRKAMHVKFLDSGGTIDGESTNDDAFRGGRKHAILLDEAAAMPNLAAIDSASKAAGLRIFVSTHEQVSWFLDIVTSGRVDVATLAWWEHPDKGRGRRLIVDPETGEHRWTSPWYEQEKATTDPGSLARNVDIKPGGDGSMVFSLSTLLMQERTYGCAPYLVGHVDFAEQVQVDPAARVGNWPVDRLEWFDEVPTEDEEAQLLLWCDLVEDMNLRLRPDQEHGYSMGVDLGDGVGATPSVISIKDLDTGYKVGRWLSRRTKPETMAKVIYCMGLWVGGRGKAPIVAVEANGGRGTTVLEDLKRMRYPRIYRHAEMATQGAKKAAALGWMSTSPRKKAALEGFSNSLFRGTFKNPDIRSIKEARTYVHMRDEMGRGSRIAPRSLGHLNDADLAEHGDMVIADMLSDLAGIHAGSQRIEEPQPKPGTVTYEIERLKWEREAVNRIV